VVLALQHEQVAHLERLAPVADEQLAVFRNRALVDAEDPHLADIRIDVTLKTWASTCLPASGTACIGCAAAPSPLRSPADWPRRIRQQLDDHVQQLGDAGAGARRDEAHRDQVPFTQGLFERRVQLARIHVAVVR